MTRSRHDGCACSMCQHEPNEQLARVRAEAAREDMLDGLEEAADHYDDYDSGPTELPEHIETAPGALRVELAEIVRVTW